MTPEILTIQDCMSRVMADVGAVAKTQRNTQQNFTFRGIDAVVNAVSPVLQKHGVVVVPRLQNVEYVSFTSSKGTQMMCCRVIVTYQFVGPGRDFLEATVPGESFDAGDKSTAKAMSVAFRTALLQALALPTDDIDPDAQIYERSAPSSAAPVGESTAQATTEGTVTSPRDAAGAQVALDAASPTLSAVPTADDAAPEQVTVAYGEGASTPSGAAPTYLTKEEQKELISDYGSNKAVIAEFKKHFGDRIQRMDDITCEMVEAMNE